MKRPYLVVVSIFDLNDPRDRDRDGYRAFLKRMEAVELNFNAALVAYDGTADDLIHEIACSFDRADSYYAFEIGENWDGWGSAEAGEHAAELIARCQPAAQQVSS